MVRRINLWAMLIHPSRPLLVTHGGLLAPIFHEQLFDVFSRLIVQQPIHILEHLFVFAAPRWLNWGLPPIFSDMAFVVWSHHPPRLRIGVTVAWCFGVVQNAAHM